MDIDNLSVTTQRIVALNGGAQIRASEANGAGVGQAVSITFGNSGANNISLAFTPSQAASVFISTALGLSSIAFHNSGGVALTTPSIPPGSAWEWTPTLMAQPFGALPIVSVTVTNNCAGDTVQGIVGNS